MKRQPALAFDNGFTLIEILIALVILSIGLMALAGIQVSALKGNAFSKRMTTAVSIAEQMVEQIRNIPYDNIQSQSASQVSQSNINFTSQVAVTNDSPIVNTKTIHVTITWTDGLKTHTVPISTIISRP
jgi:type IV pilus assembly protein PilV